MNSKQFMAQYNPDGFNMFEEECKIDDDPPMELYYDAVLPKAPLLPTQSPKYHRKYTLILDLDQTLVFSSLTDLGSSAIFLPVGTLLG
jgi:hypothetical protein